MTVFPQRPFFILYKKVQVKLADIDFSMSAKVGYACLKTVSLFNVLTRTCSEHFFSHQTIRCTYEPSNVKISLSLPLWIIQIQDFVTKSYLLMTVKLLDGNDKRYIMDHPVHNSGFWGRFTVYGRKLVRV